MFIIKNENVFIQIHRILLLLNTLKNPILFLCVYLDKLLYIVFKALRSTIIKEPVYTFICFLIDLSLFGIIKICLGFFYKLLVSFKMLSFYDLLIKRMYGLIFSILIFTHILFCIKAVLIQHGFKGVFILYFSIVILYIILDFISIVFRYNKALIEKKTNIIIVFIASILDFIMRHSKAFLSSHNLKSLREIATILPLFINFLNLSLIVIREDSMEQYQIDSVQPISLLFTIKKRDFKEPCLVNETQEEVIFVKLVYLKNRLNLIQYIDSLGLGDHFLEVTFLYV